jgi:hypothetical protein
MVDTRDEAEWRIEFERTGEEHRNVGLGALQRLPVYLPIADMSLPRGRLRHSQAEILKSVKASPSLVL